MNCGYKVTRPAFPRELVKQFSRPAEEVFRLPRRPLTWVRCSSGPIHLGLSCEKQKKKKWAPSFTVTPLKPTTHELGSCFSDGGDEFPVMCTLAHPLHGSASQGMTHIFEKASQVRSSAQGQVQQDALCPSVRMSHRAELQTELAASHP